MAAAPTVGEAVVALRRRLEVAGLPSPAADADWLACHVFGWSRTRLNTDRAVALSETAAARLAALGRRREARQPLQLLTETVGFRGLELAAQAGVFIPRPETELLAGEAIQRTPAGGLVVEPCTGSGAIACAVAAELPGVRVLASDCSPQAISLARENAARCGVAVELTVGELLTGTDPGVRGTADVVVCNPPYVAAGELESLPPEVAEWEPRQALVGGENGDELTDRLLGEAPSWLREGGWAVVEVDANRAGRCAAAASRAGLVDVAVLDDLAGRPRILIARRPGPQHSRG